MVALAAFTGEQFGRGTSPSAEPTAPKIDALARAAGHRLSLLGPLSILDDGDVQFVDGGTEVGG